MGTLLKKIAECTSLFPGLYSSYPASRFDANKDGQFNLDEANNVNKYMLTTPADMERFIEKSDKNDDGFVCANEFKEEIKKRAKVEFNSTDKDGDDRLTYDEIDSYIRGTFLPDEPFDKPTFDNVDSNKDSKLSFDEYMLLPKNPVWSFRKIIHRILFN